MKRGGLFIQDASQSISLADMWWQQSGCSEPNTLKVNQLSGCWGKIILQVVLIEARMLKQHKDNQYIFSKTNKNIIFFSYNYSSNRLQ